MPLTGTHHAALLHIARRAIRATLTDGACPPPTAPAQFPELAEPAGCFVSLHELLTHRLRGCVGRLDSTEALFSAVHNSAVNVLRDPRFRDEPLTLLDLPSLQIELTILSPLVRAQHCLDFEPAVHGIYLVIGRRGGCFLPQVARETGWGHEQLLERLCTEKLDHAPDAWKHDGAQLFTFTADIIGPEPFEPATPCQLT